MAAWKVDPTFTTGYWETVIAHHRTVSSGIKAEGIIWPRMCTKLGGEENAKQARAPPIFVSYKSTIV